MINSQVIKNKTKFKTTEIMKKIILLLAADSTAAEAAVADTISAEDFQSQLDELVAAKDTAGITALLKKSQATISSYAGNSDAVK